MDQFELRTARRPLAVSSGIPLVIVSKHLQLIWEDALLLEQRFVVLLRVSGGHGILDTGNSKSKWTQRRRCQFC
ncbi:hypothetical protein LINPERHAP2_LOCUS11813 [Linum perenne]